MNRIGEHLAGRRYVIVPLAVVAASLGGTLLSACGQDSQLNGDRCAELEKAHENSAVGDSLPCNDYETPAAESEVIFTE